MEVWGSISCAFSSLINLEWSAFGLDGTKSTAPSPVRLTSGKENSVELEAASVLQPTGQLIEVTAVQVQGDP